MCPAQQRSFPYKPNKFTVQERCTSQGNQGAVTKIRKSYWAEKSKYVQISSSQECLYRWKQMFLEEHILTDLEPLWLQAAWIQRAVRLVGEPIGNAGASSCFCATHRLRTLVQPRRKKPGDDYARISHQPRMLGAWYLITKIYVTTRITQATILYMSVRSNWSFLLFTFSSSLLVFCPAVLIDLYKSQFLICKMMRPVPTSQVDVSVKNATPHKVLIRLTWSNCSFMSATTINPQESMWRLEYIHHHISNINAECLVKRPKGTISWIMEGQICQAVQDRNIANFICICNPVVSWEPS